MPLRLTILHFAQRFLTDDDTFMTTTPSYMPDPLVEKPTAIRTSKVLIILLDS